MTYIVIGLCIFLLLIVVFISAKPISMGIEARRNIKETINDEDIQDENDSLTVNPNNQKSISDEIIKLDDVNLDLPEEVIEARNYQYNLIK